MYQHQCVDATPGDQCGGSNGLAVGGGRTQDAGIEAKHCPDGLLLILAELADESCLQALAGTALVPQLASNGVLAQQVTNGVEATARQGGAAGPHALHAVRGNVATHG